MIFPDGNEEVQMVGITATWSVATQRFVAKVNWVCLAHGLSSSSV